MINLASVMIIKDIPVVQHYKALAMQMDIVDTVSPYLRQGEVRKGVVDKLSNLTLNDTTLSIAPRNELKTLERGIHRLLTVLWL